MYSRFNCEDHANWLKERGKGIGGSDAASILGLNPYKTNVQLYNHKKGIEHFDNTENQFTIYGHTVEEPIRTIFQATFTQLEVKHNEHQIIIRDDKPYLRASLDGEIEVKEDLDFYCYWKKNYSASIHDIPKPIHLKKGMKGILECKSTFILSSMSKEKWNNQIPMNYYCQCLHYLNVKDDTDFVIIPALLVWEDVNGVRTCEIRFYGFLKEDHLEDCKYLEEKETDFWVNYIEKDIEPPLILDI